ncbi:MAG TPA: nuclear transport factor 2 family protein [Terriglobales bacterium]|nr:nuclear transport factor 2 family protein [Terriglobales bacterium]
MKRSGIFLLTILTLILCGLTSSSFAKSNDEAQIRAMMQSFQDAFNAKDLDGIMKMYAPGDQLLVFDVVPPRQYAGFDAYKKDWQDTLAMFDGPVTFVLSDLAVTTEGKLAYSHSIQHVVGKMKNGQQADLTVRVTDVYKKIKGKWLIVHEHVSVPVDLNTGKPDLQSKP